ncbi:unnamed protein [Sarcoptes scabiei]|nr:unnamed protein [Sarcoptes scabiei]
MSDRRIFKVLCLHGYRQNSQIFKTKSGGFRKILKNRIEFNFIDAPHLIPKGEQNPSDDPDCLSWWFSGENPDYFSSKHVSNFVQGFDQSLEKIHNIFVEQGPFDGLLGFSQGASMIALICILQQLGEFKHHFDFVILCSSFKSLTKTHLELFDRLGEQKLSIKSLHIIGETDQIVDPSRSESLAETYFKNPSIIKHPGGHIVPSQTIYRDSYHRFLDSIYHENEQTSENIFKKSKHQI